MCGYCDERDLGDVARAVVHHTQEAFFHADGEEVRIIGTAGDWTRAVIVRKSSPDFALVPHYVTDSHQAEWADLRLTAPAAMPDPVRHDEAQFKLYQQLWKAVDGIDAVHERMHHLAGDKHDGYGSAYWVMKLSDVRVVLGAMLESGDKAPVVTELASREVQLEAEAIVLREQIAVMESVWREFRWTRWFECLNADGHVHSSLRGCKTVFGNTAMGWATRLSGMPLEVAIQLPPEGLGPRLCSVCFPDAPVEHCRSLRDITRAEREAAKAARQEAKYVKALRPDGERFRETAWSQWCETVYRCKELLRNEVEYRDFHGHGEHRSHAASVADAARAAEVLLAREAAHPGTGATQAEIDKIIASAVRKNRKEGARI